MAVITMGGLSGGGGRLLGPMVAERLGADYVDRLILTDAARNLGATVEALHQREERVPTRGERFSAILQRILERSAVASSGGDPYFGPGAMALLTLEFEELPDATITRGHELEDEKYFEAIRDVINQLAEAGNVVIVGRGSALILRQETGVLRVGTIARMEDRVARTMESERLGREQALDTLAHRDRARADYYMRYFGVDNPDDPDIYHLVINTSDVDIEYGTELVLDASRAVAEGKLRPRVPTQA